MPGLVVQAELRSQKIDHILGVPAIQDREAGLKADRLAVAPEQKVGDGMEGAAVHPVAACADQKTDPLEHLLGRLAREGQQKNRFRVNS